ncbi:exo-beta-1,3-glucanase Exg0 [Coccidioides immitis H538.4]|uniref:Exo-beta-1,3-glucanase Exg0 n=1 Tax=Coccidioides immitis H538.4 TaxID=396776 RepID=A0A0J8S576_COCIT|nr:exo-beta-1,3-glucanase Exg0 [Coccidioides immitis H538.4]
MDIRRTDPNAYVCAIHWQVAQGTSLENIEFYMMQDDKTTQQGIWMENGSGGFLTNLTFVGGNFGAYFGNQQFTTSHLASVNCKTALQVHWDWAWTMQDVIIESCWWPRQYRTIRRFSPSPRFDNCQYPCWD